MNRLQDLSEKTGIEMIVVDEAEKITGTQAEHFKRWLIRSSYAGDPIQSTIQQPAPKTKTVLLPGISFLVDPKLAEQVVDSLNQRFAYRSCIAFISDDRREDKKYVVSLIHSFDKYNTLRLQETSGGSYHFSTDTLITKLKVLEQKYPFRFVGVGNDWLTIQTLETPKEWKDFAAEVLRVCPNEETNIDAMAKEFQKDGGKVFMWWD
ncbi:MAG: DUF4253 domain-containing protein [Bacteroidetes bacterium]|nr:DUF4253 domain-containing protein [Bacteroidota bacterium]